MRLPGGNSLADPTADDRSRSAPSGPGLRSSRPSEHYSRASSLSDPIRMFDKWIGANYLEVPASAVTGARRSVLQRDALDEAGWTR
jgi:hypothetical protein